MTADSPNDGNAAEEQANEPRTTAAVKVRDVAALAGVSPSTVSNVLNGRLDRMASATYERVRTAMDALGYTPNELARRLRTGQVKVLGLIVPSVANPYWGFVTRFVEATAREHGYQVLLCNSERDAVRETRYVETLLNSGIRGVIFGSSPLSLWHLVAFRDRGLQVVLLDRVAGTGSPIVGSVAVDNALAARMAISHLVGLGHRRIAFVSGPIGTASRRERFAGYRRALTEAGLEVDTDLVWEGSSVATFGDAEGAELGRLAAQDLLGYPTPPTALFAINDMYALGAYAGVRDLGLDVPGDVSIVGFDDVPALAEVMTPPLTTVQQPLEAMMRLATARLIGHLSNTQKGVNPDEAHVIFPPRLVVRGSTAAPR